MIEYLVTLIYFLFLEFRLASSATPLNSSQNKTLVVKSHHTLGNVSYNYAEMMIAEWYSMGINKQPGLFHHRERRERGLHKKTLSSYGDINNHLISKFHKKAVL
jgi:hypothetical protein